MTKSVKDLLGMTIEATDGTIGSIHDIYFDNQNWRIRYFVVDTSKWLPGRRVLIATEAVHRPWRDGAGLPVDLTKDQVKSSPDIDTARPVSRDSEILLFQYYGWAPYWAGPLAAPPLPPPSIISAEERRDAAVISEQTPTEHVGSSRELMGCELQATDAKAGTVEDLLIDPESSRVRYLVISTDQWLAQKNVLVSPDSISRINWAESTVLISISRHAVECSPKYDPAAP